MNNLINRIEEIYNNTPTFDINATDAEKKEYLQIIKFLNTQSF